MSEDKNNETRSTKCQQTCGDCWFSEPKPKKQDWMFCFRYPSLQPQREKGPYNPEVHRLQRACGEFKSNSSMIAKVPNTRR